MSNSDSFSAVINPAPSIPQVGIYTINIPANTQVTVEFGTDMSYGRSTATPGDRPSL